MIGDEHGSIFAGAGRVAIAAHSNLMRANRELADSQRDLAQATELEKNVNTMTRNAFVHKANAAGVVAQRDAVIEALRALAPDHPLLQQIGVNNIGKPVTNLTGYYYEAFDASIKSTLGNVDPKAFRGYRVK